MRVEGGVMGWGNALVTVCKMLIGPGIVISVKGFERITASAGMGFGGAAGWIWLGTGPVRVIHSNSCACGKGGLTPQQ